MKPEELQKWCEKHPEYYEFKKECEIRKNTLLQYFINRESKDEEPNLKEAI